MILSLSTHWNTCQHSSGEALVEEILQLGVDHVELGYDLTADLVPGVSSMVSSGAVSVDSIHNFCPVPVGAPMGHPELFMLASPVPGIRESAVRNTARTVEFAAEMGADVVVAHAGRINMRSMTTRLIDLSAKGKQYTPAYDRLKVKLLLKREKKVPPYRDSLRRSIAELLPDLEDAKVRLALENLPSWEALPTEAELEALCVEVNSPWLGAWYDVGHGQVRHNLGFISQARWIQRLAPHLCGLHVHSVEAPAYDHLMPPRGVLDVDGIANVVRSTGLAVLEPSPGTPPHEIQEALGIVRDAWQQP